MEDEELYAEAPYLIPISVPQALEQVAAAAQKWMDLAPTPEQDDDDEYQRVYGLLSQALEQLEISRAMGKPAS